MVPSIARHQTMKLKRGREREEKSITWKVNSRHFVLCIISIFIIIILLVVFFFDKGSPEHEGGFCCSMNGFQKTTSAIFVSSMRFRKTVLVNILTFLGSGTSCSVLFEFVHFQFQSESVFFVRHLQLVLGNAMIITIKSDGEFLPSTTNQNTFS